MSGKKPPRPLAPPKRPTVPRQRSRRNAPTARPQAAAPQPSPPPAAPPPAAPPRAPDEAVPGPPGDPPGPIASVAVVVGVLVLAAVAVFLVVRSDDSVDQGGARGLERVPAAPVVLAPQTSWVSTRVTASGDLVVRHWIRSRTSLFGLRLAVPASAAVPGARPPRVRDVLVVAGGREAPGPRSLRKGRASYAFTGTHDVFVRYRVAGAVERSDSVAGRALARFTALDVDVTPPMLTTTYAVSGGKVLNLACSDPEPGAVPFPCGGPAGSGWEVQLEKADRNDVVTAQLDLP